jgi:hypothetical protein
LEHDIDWVNAVMREINIQEMHDNIMRMKLHGYKQKDINKYQRAMENELKVKKPPVSMPSIAQLQAMGFKAAKPSKTRFKN